jgi:hypothetical protein
LTAWGSDDANTITSIVTVTVIVAIADNRHSKSMDLFWPGRGASKLGYAGGTG